MAADARITRIRAATSASGTATGRITRIRASATGLTTTLVAIVAAVPTQEPFAYFLLDASASTGPPATYAYVQTSGPTVVIVPNGPTATVQAPALDPGATLGFTITVSSPSAADATTSITVAVFPVTHYELAGTSWSPSWKTYL